MSVRAPAFSLARWAMVVIWATPQLAACEKPGQAPRPASPSAAPPTPAPATPGRTCSDDADCTRPWHPSMEGCGSLERCFGDTCLAPPAVTGAPNDFTGSLTIETPAGERRYAVEIADEHFETQRGLMCRPEMRADWGMLFLLDETRIQSFWMKNTLMPLDMVFLTPDWTIAGIVSDVPPRTLDPRGVNVPSRYVLELVAGEARRAGLAPGQRARFYRPRGE
jgi:uncharacterized membrane protein (UPF0127 family)